ncbi:MAG: hypothetical protein HY548_04475 [Elusimicrobia bacterium]|nr:hypothetical protein [Elusimicrobiota bacterium]
MEEVKQAFSAEPIRYHVGGKELVLEPMPFKRFKKALAVVMGGLQDLEGFSTASGLDAVRRLPDILVGKVNELMPILFAGEQHTFITPDWVEENLSLPLAQRILVDAVRINGVTDFLGVLRGGRLQAPPSEKAPGQPEAPKT